MFTKCSQEINTDNTINTVYTICTKCYLSVKDLNTNNTINTICTIYTRRDRTCGSGKKYKQCCGKSK